MFKSEAILIEALLKDISKCRVLNVCSSDKKFWTEEQPYIWRHVMAPLLDRGCELHNFDMKAMDGVDIVNNCADMKDVADATYDVVLFFSGIEHIVEVDKAINEIKRVLKSDGVAFMSAPGVYPKHDDPIDTMLRLPTKDSWASVLGKSWNVEDFQQTEPEPAKPFYNFEELVYATIIKTLPVN